MSVEFEEFARAATRGGAASAESARRVSRVAVLGGGPDARLLAALALSENYDVSLFSAYGNELKLLRSSSGIGLRGDGPVGTYHVDRQDGPSVSLTAELDAVVDSAELILLTGPVHKQRTYAMVLADHLRDGQVLVVAPGRSFGAAEVAWNLKIAGCHADITIVEIQGLPFWIKPEGANLTLSRAPARVAATLPNGRNDVLDLLTPLFPGLEKCNSVLESGFADFSAAVDVPALMCGGAGLLSGGAPIPLGGEPLAENATFATLIGEDQRRLIGLLAEERRTVARSFGIRKLPDTSQWVRQYAGEERGDGARPVPDRAGARMLMRDGVIGSLVPLASAAQIAGIRVPQTDALITMASGILDADIAAAGRRFDTMGITATETETVRRAMNALAPRGRSWTTT